MRTRRRDGGHDARPAGRRRSSVAEDKPEERMKAVKLLAMAMLVAGCTGVYGSDSGWLTDFEAAKKQAKERKVPILADFSGSDWCGWCMKLDKEVFSNKEFKEYAKDNLVLFLADFPSKKAQDDAVKKQNKYLASKYRVEGFPTVLVLDSNEKVLLRTGYRPGGAGKYVEYLRKKLAKE